MSHHYGKDPYYRGRGRGGMRYGGGRPRSYETSQPMLANSAYYAASGSSATLGMEEDLGSHSRMRSRAAYRGGAPSHSRGGDRNTVQGQNGSSANVKSRDFGSAFIGEDMENTVKRIIEDSKHASAVDVPDTPAGADASSSAATLTPMSANYSPAHPGSVHGETTGSKKPLLTPAMIVDEFKRAGHFDLVRKSLLQSLLNQSATTSSDTTTTTADASSSSDLKGRFLTLLDSRLLERIQRLSPDSLSRLSKQDARLQHSELVRWIEEEDSLRFVVEKLMEEIRDSGLLERRGDLGKLIIERVGEIVKAERRIRGLKVKEGSVSDSEKEEAEPDEEDQEILKTAQVKPEEERHLEENQVSEEQDVKMENV